MRALHSARQILAFTVVALALAGCSQSEGPSQFNPTGVSADLTTAASAFDSPMSASFGAAGGAIAATLGSAAPTVVSPLSALRTPAAAERYGRSIAGMLPAGGSPMSASVSAIPAAVLGTTFVWDLATGAYVASDFTGAPAHGVRFLLYAVNPLTGQPADPLNDVGYADVTDVGSGSILATRVLVVSDGVTYLDYTVRGTGTATSGAVSVEGFASNGTERVTFSLDNTIAQSVNGMVLTLDYGLAVPSRGLQVSYTATFGNIAPGQVAVTLDFTVSGRNGTVRVSGTYGAEGGAFSVKVNGDVFATVTIGTGEPVVTTASGTALTPDEEAALQHVLEFYDGSLGVFDDLMSPVGS